MYYGKLKEHFTEICKKKSLNKDEVQHELLKDYVKNNLNLCSKKYQLKNDYDQNKVLIIGDDGQFLELSDGSKIYKSTFEKMYQDENGDLKVNPNEFFSYNWEIKKEKPKVPKEDKPINPDKFFNDSSAQKLKKFFKDIDITKIKFQDEDTKIHEHKKIYL